MEIAAKGKVKCYFASKPLSELKAVYEGLEKGTIAGRVVLQM